MAFDVGSFVPNWELFVEWLLPITLAVIFAMALVYRFFTRKRMTFAEMLNYIPVAYLFFVFYEIGEYMYGTREHIWDRLFTMHFPNMMFLIVCVGIGQVLYYFNSERAVSV
jgi:hypothetical protein